MKAVRIHSYGGPEVLFCEEVERPRPNATQVLVEVRAAAVNQFDITVREGRFITPIAPPRIIGSDGAGVVVETGAEVTDVAPGDEVLFTGAGIGTQGSYAEYAVIAAVQAVPKPPSLSFAEAAAMGLVFPTALYALARRAAVQEGETVLVQGAAGGVGSAAVQLAKALGARAVGTVLEAGNVDGVLDLGAEAVIDLSSQDLRDGVMAATGDRGVDVVIEIAAADNLAADLGVIVKGGRIVVVGQGSAPEAAVPFPAASPIDASFLYMSSSNAGRAGMAQMLREIGDMVEAGSVRPVVGTTLPLAEARAAHELLSGRHFGKIVLVPQRT
jgi:NADPH2:quinone reductase